MKQKERLARIEDMGREHIGMSPKKRATVLKIRTNNLTTRFESTGVWHTNKPLLLQTSEQKSKK
jgi:hypothetical protein